MQRRTLLRRLGMGTAVAFVGCSGNPDADQLVNYYSEGYQTYQAGDEKGGSATEYEGEKERQMRRNARDLMAEAKNKFEKAQDLAEKDQAVSYCKSAKMEAKYKQSVYNHLASGKKNKALSASRAALDHEVVAVSRVREAASSGLL